MGMKLVEGGAATGDPLLVARADGTNPVDHESCSLRLGTGELGVLAVDVMDDLGDGPQRRAIVSTAERFWSAGRSKFPSLEASSATERAALAWAAQVES
jgi:hypothetical protein